MSRFAFSSPASRVDQPSESPIWRCSSDPAGGRVMRNRSVLGSYEESRHVISVGLDGRSNNPIGTWKRGAAGTASYTKPVPAETAEPGTAPSRNPRVTGTLPAADWRVTRNPADPGRLGRQGGQTRPQGPRYTVTGSGTGRSSKNVPSANPMRIRVLLVATWTPEPVSRETRTSPSRRCTHRSAHRGGGRRRSGRSHSAQPPAAT